MISPRSLGYRLPAEWEPQEAVWLSWPTNPQTWEGHWQAAETSFAEMVLKFSQYVCVHINLELRLQEHARRLISRVGEDLDLKLGEVRFFDHATDDAWVRDHGPIYLRHVDSGGLLITDWEYNAWGGKYPSSKDNKIPRLIAESTAIERVGEAMVLEGGSLEVNEQGDLLVTKDCLLNPNRNPGMPRKEIEARLIAGLGVERVHWLEGCIEGDDTDGHIDNLARFYNDKGILVAGAVDQGDTNYEMLRRLQEDCYNLKLCSGQPDITVLPLPDPVYREGNRLPMSYLNFFVTNGAVFVPIYNQSESDSRALEIIGKAYPDRDIQSVDCRTLILEGGALHCLTQQVPQSSQ
jgi:agmatine deiminase